MTVSRRTRYEVLRRDNQTCRYCHATDAPLTVDHVTPVALGGSDAPDNLVAACKDCNAGKAASSPDAALVADVREDALRQAERTRQAYAVLVERMGERDEYVDEVTGSIEGWFVPKGWRQSIANWYEMGVPVELVVDAADVAFNRYGVTERGRFSYMCGIVWNHVGAAAAAVTGQQHIEGNFVTEDAMFDERYKSYEAGRRFERKRWMANDVYADMLSGVIDGDLSVPDPWNEGAET